MQANHLPWHQRRVATIRLGELAAVFISYIAYASLYWLTIVVNAEADRDTAALFAKQIAVNYGVRLLLTIPVWWLLFRYLKQWPLQRRVLLHFPLSLLYVGAWLFVFHTCCDILSIGYMTGRAMAWDLYIPFLLYLLQFGIFHAYEYMQKAREAAQRAAEQQQLALQAELSALKAQIQPHFLFNTLNSISASVPPAQERTRELIALLADTFRFGLQASQSKTVPLRDELNFLRSYLALEQQRFGARLQVRWDLDESLLQRQVPPLLLQPLVENAIQHAVAPSVQPVEITLRISTQEGELCMEVADTGPTLPKGDAPKWAENGVGLRNTRLRLEKEFGRTLTARYNTPQGLIFTLQIPFA
jgi:two-component system, LytTR family, sensor kinase